MKKIVLALALASAVISSWAKPIISIVYPYSASHGTAPVFHPMVEELNKIQNKYTFVFEVRPGGDGLIALNYMNQSPATRVSIIYSAFVENIDSNKIQESDYVHIAGMGNMCMALFSKTGDESKGIASISKIDSIVIGGVGFGTTSHLSGLNVGEKLGIPVRNIAFRSNREGLLNLAQDGGVNFVIDRVDAWNDLGKQSKVQPKILGVTCDNRIKSIPHVKTMAEQGIVAPAPWIAITSNKDMPIAVRDDISGYLDQALLNIGAQRVWELSSLEPLVFSKKDVKEFVRQKILIQRELNKKYKAAIDADRGITKNN